MCGIVGVAGTLSVKMERTFKDMLILDSLRGEDSTGVAMVHMSGDISIVKEVGDPFVLLDSRRFIKSFASNHRVLIGHNRWATTGKINRANAHPFECGDLVGVHNGTLRNKWNIPNQALFDTDSEALYNHIDAVGLSDAMSIVAGAWALVWYNKEDNSVNFLRNQERPMWIATTEDGKSILWASEQWMINVAAQRNDIGKLKIKELKVDQWHKYILPASGVAIPPPLVEHIKGKEEIQEKKATGVVPSPDSTKGTSVVTGGINSKVGKSIALIGLTIKESTKGTFYCVMCEADGASDDEFRAYGSQKELTPLLLGRWTGFVSYTISSGDKVEYHKVNTNTLFKATTKKDVNNVPITKEYFNSKHKRCCNCYSKLDFEENWVMLDADSVLCESCNSADILEVYRNAI